MADTPARTPPRRAQPPLVGREREQALMREQLAAALEGEGGLALIGGEAGIGRAAPDRGKDVPDG